MAAPEVQALEHLDFEPEFGDNEVGKIERWRFECLERAGYRTDLAVVLSRRLDVDLHMAVRIMRSGKCSQADALRILV